MVAKNDSIGDKLSDPEKNVQAPPVLVLNAAAARGKAGRTWRRVRDELRSWRATPTVIETEYSGHGTEIARSAAAALMYCAYDTPATTVAAMARWTGPAAGG